MFELRDTGFKLPPLNFGSAYMHPHEQLVALAIQDNIYIVDLSSGATVGNVSVGISRFAIRRIAFTSGRHTTLVALGHAVVAGRHKLL